jgi:cellulose synthase/poly-beta-1,6-N-acetylglucosamine synthase-like glycosyltransferase
MTPKIARSPASFARRSPHFSTMAKQLACVQARLAPYNRNANFLTRMFALDFCQWFDAMLRGLQRMGLPVPLGGTSNHFRMDVLRRVGAWDPFNVTEDADLGLRLWRLGWRTRMLDSTTWEEAPVRTLTWFRQRTRWIRGYMQTFFVHARSPKTLDLPALSLRGWTFLVLFVGASWVFALVNPVFWALLGYSVAVGGSELDWAFGPIVGVLALFSLVIGNFLSVFVAFAGPVRRRWWGLQFWAVFTPLYWIMISAVAYWALFTFFHNPFRWEKTPHGLDPRIEQL